MPCPVCSLPIGHPDADHRMCVFKLLKTKTIQSVAEWEDMASDTPKTIRKGRIRAVLPKETTTPPS